MLKKYLMFFLITCPLVATVTEPWGIKLESGYRQDHIKWRLDEEITALPYKEKYKDLKYFQNSLEIQKIYRDIYFDMSGSYSAFAKGEMEQESSLNRFFFNTDGYSYSLSSSLGILANLTPDRHYQVILMPFFNYSFFSLRLNRKNSSPEYTDPLTSSIDTLTFATLPKQLKNDWYGPAIGMQLWVRPYCPIEFQLGYSYHWLYLKSDFEIRSNTREVMPGDVLISDILQIQKGKVNSSGNLGHFGFIKSHYNAGDCYKVSLAGYIYYVSSQIHSVDVKQTEQELVGTPFIVQTESKRKYKLRSTSVQILLGITRFF